ncbi:hypothetical protein, partial [Acinetobacter baumannii]|uniref:hypothetical protein n=1 Tax=Acinetobacter baumannii TaxID=470 RepID=UPI003F68385C
AGGQDSFINGGGRNKDEMYSINRKGEKEQWTQRPSNENVYIAKALIETMSDHEVKTDTVIHHTLETGMNIDLPGHIIGQVRHNVYDSTRGRFLLI